MADASNVARLVVEEIMVRCSQLTLLSCRRMMAHAAGGPPTRKKRDLIDELMGMCEHTAYRQHICERLLGEYSMPDVHSLIARLRGYHGCQVIVCQHPRRQDLVAAIISTNEHKAGCTTDSAGCGPARNNGLYRCSNDDFSDMEPEGTTNPETSTALVATETLADPSRLRRSLHIKWRKKYAKWQRKRTHKMALADLQSVLAQAVRENAVDVTVRALREVVAARLGIALDGKNRFHFDKALLTLTNAPEKRPRAHRRFKVATRRSKRDQN